MLESTAMGAACSLALIGNAQWYNITREQARLGQDLDRSRQLRSENVEWALLDLAGIRVDLLELVLRNADNPAVVRKENGARNGGALIESENVFHDQP